MKTRPCFLHRLSLALVLLASVAATTRLHAQMLLNGSFENPATSTEIFFSAGANWTQIGSGNDFVCSNTGSGYGGGTTPYGSQYLEVLYQGDGASQSDSGLTNGQTYLFTLAAAPTNTNPATVTLSVTGGATASQTFPLTVRATPSGAGVPLPFQTLALALTCTSSQAVTLSLVDASPNQQIAVDNAQLSVPEPSAWALLAVGTVGLGWTLRRRVRAA